MGMQLGFLGRRKEITYVSTCPHAWHRASAQKNNRLRIFDDYFSHCCAGGHGMGQAGIPPLGVFCPTPYVSELCLGPLYLLSA